MTYAQLSAKQWTKTDGHKHLTYQTLKRNTILKNTTCQLPLVTANSKLTPHLQQNLSSGETLVPQSRHSFTSTFTLYPQLLQYSCSAVRSFPHGCPSSVFPSHTTLSLVSFFSILLVPHLEHNSPSHSNPHAGTGHFFPIVLLHTSSWKIRFIRWKLQTHYYTPPHNLGGGGYNGSALSRPSVGRSIISSPLSCPLYKSYTVLRIFFELGWNVHLNKGMCRTHVAHVTAQGQGHNWRSNIKQSNIRQHVVFTL